MKTIRDFIFKNKKVLVRCDFNVPLSDKGGILDDFRIKQALPTIKYLIKQKAKVILISHLGRPEGKVVEALRFDRVAKRLSKLIGQPVKKMNSCLGPEVKKAIENMRFGQIVLLENVQFNPEEKTNDSGFAKKLAGYADIFVMEAFGQSHRDYASISGVQKHLPSVAGFLLEKEIRVLTGLLKSPKKPLVAIIGGKKVEDKSKVIDAFLVKADFILLGGLIKKEIDEKKRKFKHADKILGPFDPPEALDIGPETIKIFTEKIVKAETVFWSGPMGRFEDPLFRHGSLMIAKAIIKSGAFSVAGGGETVSFLNSCGLAKKFDHISTGGGAMLNFLAGERMPGLETLISES